VSPRPRTPEIEASRYRVATMDAGRRVPGACLPRRGAARLDAFPRRGADLAGLDVLDLWNGPEAMFLATGFEVARDNPARPVLRLAL
jgi:hypothetical protein